MAHPFSYAIAFIILLWPSTIADEELPTPARPQQEPSDPSKNLGKAVPPAKAFPQSSFPIDPPVYIDKKAFLLSFRRQAQLGLTACLEGWRRSPQSVLVSGVIDKKGQLRGLKTSLIDTAFPSCVEEEIAKMNFSALTGKMKDESQQLQWKIHW